MASSIIQSPASVVMALSGIAAFFFYLEKRTRWRMFEFFPPLIWIYLIPLLLSNGGILPAKSAAYEVVREYGLPIFIVLLLLGINVRAAFRIMGRGILVMLMGTLGIMAGGPIAYFVVHRWLPDEAWKAFGALAGSWIGGTGNMAAVADGLKTPPDMFGLAVLADNLIYIVWLPILLGSKAFAERFNRWTKVASDRLERMDTAAEEHREDDDAPIEMRHFIYLAMIGFAVTAFAGWLAPLLPVAEPVLSTSTWNVLIVTTVGIALSFTPARTIPRAHEIAMAILYVFVARMGASSSLAGLADAPAFLLGAFIWIIVHGFFCIFGAWIFKVDVHSAAIASAANVGGAASASIVAAYHRESLVPVAILMALLGYAIGNYAAFVTAQLCFWVR